MQEHTSCFSTAFLVTSWHGATWHSNRVTWHEPRYCIYSRRVYFSSALIKLDVVVILMQCLIETSQKQQFIRLKQNLVRCCKMFRRSPARPEIVRICYEILPGCFYPHMKRPWKFQYD